MFDYRIGLLGFGEAGYHLAAGFREEGVAHISSFDINTDTPGLGERIRQRAYATRVDLVESPSQLAGRSDILLSVVTADSAHTAALQMVPYLAERHFYADLNSVSPETKQQIDRSIGSTGAKFVEAAVMAPLPSHNHKVPILMAGVNAARLTELLAPIGMQLEVISDQIGAASAVKMCRSIVVKGLEALLLECAMGAVHYNADERVFASLEESYPAVNWKELAGYAIGRVIEHGGRRAREMEEVAATLRSAGIKPVMSEATVKTQDWGAGLNLKEEFGDAIPRDYRALVHAISDRLERKST